jgi:hypothetical protein
MAVGLADRLAQVNTKGRFAGTGEVATAVVTGDHPFDVVSFHHMFRSLPDVDAYVQHLQDYVSDWGKVRTQYDVVLFYNFQQETPPESGPGRGWINRARAVLEELGETEQGIVVLHHALNAFLHWEFWSRLVGIPYQDRICPMDEMGAGCYFEDMPIDIADPEHPIVKGFSPWSMYGELWDFAGDALDPGCHRILVTDHPKMRRKAVAWVHQFGKARVFYLQPGHDEANYADPTFREVLSRGIRWAAGRL